MSRLKPGPVYRALRPVLVLLIDYTLAGPGAIPRTANPTHPQKRVWETAVQTAAPSHIAPSDSSLHLTVEGDAAIPPLSPLAFTSASVDLPTIAEPDNPVHRERPPPLRLV